MSWDEAQLTAGEKPRELDSDADADIEGKLEGAGDTGVNGEEKLGGDIVASPERGFLAVSGAERGRSEVLWGRK